MEQVTYWPNRPIGQLANWPLASTHSTNLYRAHQLAKLEVRAFSNLENVTGVRARCAKLDVGAISNL
jgi:hypothetical protein